MTVGIVFYRGSAGNGILREPANIEVASVVSGVLTKRMLLQFVPELENGSASITAGVNAEIGIDLAAIDAVTPAAIVFRGIANDLKIYPAVLPQHGCHFSRK